MDLTELKQYLNIASDDTTYDPQLTGLYEMCLSYLREKTGLVYTKIGEGYSPVVKTYSYRNVSGQTMFKCNDFPITSTIANSAGVTISIDDMFFITNSAITADLFTITAIVGYSTLPTNITTLLYKMVEYLFKLSTSSNYFNQSEQKQLSPNMMDFPEYIQKMITYIR